MTVDTKKGSHRIQEAAQKAGRAAEEIAVKVVHAAQETVQKAMAGKARRREQEASKQETSKKEE